METLIQVVSALVLIRAGERMLRLLLRSVRADPNEPLSLDGIGRAQAAKEREVADFERVVAATKTPYPRIVPWVRR